MPFFFLGTTSSKAKLEAITGYIVNEYIKERSEVVKEILIRRAVAPVSKIRKLKFFALSMNDYDKFSSMHSQVMLGLTEGLSINSYVVFTGEAQNKVFESVNAKYPYGDMSKEIRTNYICDLDNEFGDKLINLYKNNVNDFY
jgi:hypothetical protein